MSGRYRTVVADPPWPYGEGFALGPGHGKLEVRPLPYDAMSVDDIAALPVRSLADPKGARLFLWTTNRYLREAFKVQEAWGFTYRQTLVWHKSDANLPASIAPNSAEFILVGTLGKPGRTATIRSSVLKSTRKGGHSTKPEFWLDYFESISPGPYLELFARRNRLGWDTWGNECFEHVDLSP